MVPPLLGFKQGWLIPQGSHKGRQPSGGRDLGVVGVLCPWKEAVPSPQAWRSYTPQCALQTLVGSLCLTNGFWVVTGWQTHRGTRRREESTSSSGRELRTSTAIWDQGCRGIVREYNNPAGDWWEALPRAVGDKGTNIPPEWQTRFEECPYCRTSDRTEWGMNNRSLGTSSGAITECSAPWTCSSDGQAATPTTQNDGIIGMGSGSGWSGVNRREKVSSLVFLEPGQ